jgi:MFS family permease
LRRSHLGRDRAALEARGLVCRADDPNDGRRTVLSLTESGETLLRRRRSARSETLSASILLSFDPFLGATAALWLIGWRVLQAIGGSMLRANSAAILTDAFPEDQRGFALGINQVAGLSGQFIGLVAGGLLAAWDWRALFWVNVPVGIFGTLWAYRRLREVGHKSGGHMDWWETALSQSVWDHCS